MIDVKDEMDTYLSAFARFEQRAANAGEARLLPVRKAAIARFAELGFPTTRHEEWRFTNVAPIARTAFRPAAGDAAGITPEQLVQATFADADCTRLVFVNGRFAPRLSVRRALPDGVRVESLAAAIASDAESTSRHLARYAKYEDQAFTALNTALMEDGAFIYVPRGRVVEQPIHVVFVSTANSQPQMSHPRNLIVADIDSQITVVESYVGLDAGVYLTNAVTELVAGENTVIDHYKIGREAEGAYHVGTLRLQQKRSSNVRSHAVTLGGALVRNDIHVVLDGEGCDCTLNGLYVLGGTQHVDNHLRVEHAKPHCHSREVFKGVLDDKSRGVFSGRIVVHEDAQKTDAKQSNMNLLLSEDALVDTKPQLEIFADDVKCTHGATIGQVDPDALFYLRSRGIDEEAARDLLIYAFARESLDQVHVRPLHDELESLISARRLRQEQVTENV